MRTKLMKNVSHVVAPLGVGISGTGGGIGLWMLQEKSSLSNQLNDWEEKLTEEKTRHRNLSEEQQRLLQRLGFLYKIDLDSSSSTIQILEQQISNHQKSSNNLDSQISQLEGQKPTNESKISQLTEQVSNEKTNVDNEKKKVEDKNSEIASTSKSISEKDGIVSSRTNTIQSKLEQISSLRSSVGVYNGLLSNFYRTILVDDAPAYDFTKPINFKSVDLVDFNDSHVSFKLKVGNDQTKEIKLRKNNSFFDIDQRIRDFKNTELHHRIDQGYPTWRHGIRLWFYDRKIGGNYVNKKYFDIDLSTIFKKENMKRVAAVLTAFEVLTNFEITIPKANEGFSEFTWTKPKFPDVVGVGGWKESKLDQWNLWTLNFQDKDEFLKYLISKVFELIHFKKVDFSDLVSPVFKKSTYETAKDQIQKQD